jgi:predicted metal-dependent peptidase
MSRIRTGVEQELLDKEYVSPDEKAAALATALYNINKTYPFYGSILQCLNITYTHILPTAGVSFNAENKRWDLYINPHFFVKKLSSANREAVALHEIFHITHKHPLRIPFLKISAKKRQLMNIAADMVINQLIQNLPNGCSQCPPPELEQPCQNSDCPGRCIFVEDFFDTDEKGVKTQWPKNKTMEWYYEALIKRFTDPNDNDSDSDGEGEGGGGEGDPNGKSKPSNGKGGQPSDGNAGGGAQSKDLPQTLDEHMWDGSAEEKDMLEATEDLVKRAMVKSKLSYSDLPGHVQDLLEYAKQRKTELNYKQLIMSAIKKHASGHERKHTWARKSKRFGFNAPGTKVGDLPKLNIYADSSGSISIEELNDFMGIVDEFLRVGSRKCTLSFFHTSLYGKRQHKLGTKVSPGDLQSGGTELTDVMKDIVRTQADLSIVITDGCYGDVDIESTMRPGQKFPQTLFIISKGGDEDHPLKRLGDTIKCV